MKNIKKKILIILVSVLLANTAGATTWQTVACGYWWNSAVWSGGVVPSYSSADTFLISYPIAFDDDIILQAGAFMQIDSMGGLCGHHNFTVMTGAWVHQMGILEIDSLFLPGGAVICDIPSETIITYEGTISGTGILTVNGNEVVVGEWFQCVMPDFAFTIGIDERETTGTSLFPNPGNGRFTLTADAVPAGAFIRIADLSGRIVYESSPLNNTLRNDFDVSFLRDGTYYLSLISRDSVVRRIKILVMK